MSIKDVRPTTLEGVKRLARQLAKLNDGIKHGGHLDRAAQQADFQNFRHAKAQLQHASPPRSRDPKFGAPSTLFLTAYWSDLKTGAAGRETVNVTLQQPWPNLVGPRSLRHSRGLRNFRGQSSDHLVVRQVLGDSLQARKEVCAAARTLVFMDATRLQPGGARAGIVAGVKDEKLPRSDHGSRWRSLPGDFVVLVDEPYESAVQSAHAAREDWAARHGYRVVRVNWPGMYYPDLGAAMFLVAKAEHRAQLDAWATALSILPAPPMATSWTGVSAPYYPLYRSPGEVKQDRKPRRPPDLRKRRSTSATRPYAGFGAGAGRRPNGRMPIEVHDEVARLLREVIGGAFMRSGLANRLELVRCELDEWVQREYSADELDNERFGDMYYGDIEHRYSRSIPQADKLRYMGHLDRIEEAVKQHYPDSQPQRWILGRLMSARNSLVAWIDQ